MNYKLVEKFLTRLRVQRFSENSIENYKSQLIYFLKISNQYKPEDISDNQLEKFIIWLVNEKYWSILSKRNVSNTKKIL